MIYRGTYKSETITFSPEDEMCRECAVELYKSAESGHFCVMINDCDYDWVWEFETDSVSDYERIKFNIMEIMFESETIDEFVAVLDDVFTDGFADILIDDECGECCGCCDCCC
jgi:hypothetical protein